jgi:hypothetical protein
MPDNLSSATYTLAPSMIPDRNGGDDGDGMTEEYLAELSYNELRTHASRHPDVEVDGNPKADELRDLLEGRPMP